MASNISEGKRWFKVFARSGYAARGLVYTIIGIFAVLAAVGSGETKDTRSALQTLLERDVAGSLLAIALVISFVSYSLWRFVQAGFDTDRHGTDAKGLAIRAVLVASGVVYAVLALYVWSLALGGGLAGGGSGSDERSIASMVSGFVGSRWAALILGIVFAGVGMAHVIKAWKRGYEKYYQADADTMRMVHPVAITGLIARGVVFLIIAFLLLFRSSTAEAGAAETPGLGDALDFIRDLPGGTFLLAAMGLGLTAFAAYSFTEAVWRRVNVEDADLPGDLGPDQLRPGRLGARRRFL